MSKYTKQKKILQGKTNFVNFVENNGVEESQGVRAMMKILQSTGEVW